MDCEDRVLFVAASGSIFRKLGVMAAGTVAACFLAASANAAPLYPPPYPTPGTYDITGVFNDGGMLSGSFTIDQYGYLIEPTDIKTTTGTIMTGQLYTLPPQPSALGFQPITSANSVEFTYNYSPTLQITFQYALGSVKVDPFDITPADSFECIAASGTYCAGPGRDFVSGEATITPVPATLPLLAGGLGLVGMFARRKKRHAHAVAV